MENERVKAFNKNACIQGVLEASKAALKPGERNEILQDLSERLSAKKNLGFSDEQALSDTFKELFAEHAKKKTIETAQALRKALAHNKIIKFIDDHFGKPEDFAEGLQSKIGGTISVKKGARFASARLEQLKVESNLIGKIGLNLDKNGVKADFIAKAHGADLMQEFFKPGSTGNEKARLMSESIRPAYREITEGLRANGIPIEDEKEFMVSHHRDPERLLHTHDTMWKRSKYKASNKGKVNVKKDLEMAYQRYKKVQLQHLDIDKTFKNGMIDQDDFLRATFKNQTIYDPMKRDTALEDLRTYGGLGASGSKRRKMFYKDGYSFFKENEIYGYGDVFNSIEETIAKGSKLIGLSKDFSTSPYKVLGSVVDELKKRPGVTQKIINDLNRQYLRFDELTGRAAIPVNNTLNNITNAWSGWQIISKLGGTIARAFTDLNGYATSLQVNFGEGVLHANYDALKNYISHMKLGMDKQDLENAGYWQKRITGQIASRFTTMDGPVGMMGKAASKFLNINMIHWQDKMLSGGIIDDITRKFFQNSGKSMDKLNLETRRFLTNYDISSDEWDLMRKNPSTGADRRKRITPDDPILNYSKEDVASHLKKNVKDLTEKEYYDVRQNIRMKYIGLLRDESQFVYLEPDIIEKSMFRVGTKPGTKGGMAAKLFLQFHSWQFGVNRRIMGRMLSDIASRPGVMPKVTKAMPLLAGWVAGNMITGYISEAAINITSGKGVPDPTQVSTWAKASLGATGVLGETIAGFIGKNLFGDSPVLSAGGPSISELDTFLKIFNKTTQGNLPTKMAFYLAKGNIPLINLIYTRLAFNYLVMWRLEDKLFPGMLWRQVRAAEKRGDPPYLVSPLSVKK